MSKPVRNDETYYCHNQYQPFLREGKEIADWAKHETCHDMRKFMKIMVPIIAIVLTVLFVGVYVWG